MTDIFNTKSVKPIRKNLRKNMPEPEKLLWRKLRNRQLLNYKFRRQFSVGKYIVDFYCPERKLAIELDGESHFLTNEAMHEDKNRQRFIENLGIKFLRFTNEEIMKNMDGVLEVIESKLKDLT